MAAIKVLLLSDTHGYLDPHIADLAKECDFAVHAGDIGSALVLKELAFAREVIAVRGNNDVHWPDGQSLLASLPEQAGLDLPGGRLIVVHGHKAGTASRRHATLRARFPCARMVVYGHSHRQVSDCDALPWIVNPGAAGRERTFGGPSCFILTIEEERWQLTPFRFPLSKGRP